MKLRIGLVGLGEAWEARHLPALRAMSDRFEVRAVCTEVALRAENAAREFNASAIDGFRALATREDIDAIVMLSSEWYGPLPILAACDAGKAVYCAAALDLNPEQALQVCRRVEDSGIAFMTEFPRRHAPATVRLKELIATRLGKPKLLICQLRREIATAEAKTGVSNIIKRDLMELVDWCRYVAGAEPHSVLGVCNGSWQQGDYRLMNIDFSANDSGPIAQISCGHDLSRAWREAIHFRPPAALQVQCENGIAFIDLPSSIVWFDEAGRHMESLESERPVGEQMLAMFHRAVTSLVRRMGDLQDAHQALTLVLKAEESSRSGTRLFFDGFTKQ